MYSAHTSCIDKRVEPPPVRHIRASLTILTSPSVYKEDATASRTRASTARVSPLLYHHDPDDERARVTIPMHCTIPHTRLLTSHLCEPPPSTVMPIRLYRGHHPYPTPHRTPHSAGSYGKTTYVPTLGAEPAGDALGDLTRLRLEGARTCGTKNH